jgi:acyl-CoA thioester hydrolase
MTEPTIQASYAIWASETIRYGDLDRQGHVNNAVFATLLESGRVAFLCNDERPITEPGTQFVIARLVLDFKAELFWPGTAEIGTRVAKIGRSSVTLEQAIFQNGVCAAVADTVIVSMDQKTRRSSPLGTAALDRFKELQVPAR